MKLYQLLCLLFVGSLLIVGVFSETDDSFDEEDDDSDDGIVEVEDEEQMMERPMYQRPIPSGPTHFHEPFDTRAEFLKRWVFSQAKKDGAEETVSKYDGKWEIEEPNENPIQRDLALILKSKAKHHAIAAKLDRPFEFTGKPFIAQYEVRFQNGMDCGGAYMKLLSTEKKLNLKQFTDKTPYTIMFGPDKCGNDVKLHFIFRHKNPITGEYEEKHAEKPTAKLDSFFSDKKTHLYTLIVRPDNTYEIRVDNGLVSSGSLLENFSPPVNPPQAIEDPDDEKPDDWDDREKIEDPDAKKPDDWDESEPSTIIDENAEMPDGWLEDEEVYIPDPSATKPEDWDEEMDGEWEAPRIDNPKCKDAPGCGKWEPPTIPNPKYKGVWKRPLIDNPAYRGEWKPKVIPNPNYFEDKQPYKMTPIGALGLELWSMTNDIVFDNFIIADNESVVEEFTAITWEVKKNSERAAGSTGSWWQSLKQAADERPWLWGIYVMVLLIPVVILSICLCPRSGPVKPEDIAAHKKKFDDTDPDVIDEEGEEEAQKAVDEDGEEAAGETGAGGDAEAAGGVAEENQETGAAGDGNAADADEEGEEDGEVGEPTVTNEGSPKKSGSPRRRKARKE